MMGSTRHRYLHQLAATENGDRVDENHVKLEALNDRKIQLVDETEPSTISSSGPRRSYQQNQRHTRTGSFWQNLLSRRAFSAVKAPSKLALEAAVEGIGVNLDSMEKGNGQWKHKRNPQEIDDAPVGTTFGFEAELSCVPSSESEESINEHGRNVRTGNGATNSGPAVNLESPSQSQPQLSRISRSGKLCTNLHLSSKYY